MTMATAEWKPVKLDELGFVGRGKSRHRPRNAAFLYGGPYPFFQTGDIKAANFRLTEYTQTYSEEGLAQSKLWKPGTLCITIAANIAENAILGIEGCFPDSVVGFVADPEKADIRFIKYCMDTLKLGMQGVSQGAAQDNLSVEKLLTFDFRVPALPVQRRIADILSAYDELMENSQRRIRILEAMTRALYRDWFVHFRFPGHEKLPRVSSPLGDIPQGWEVRNVKDVATVTYGFPFASEKFNTDGIGRPVIRIRDIPEGFSPTFTDEDAEPKYHVKNGHILVGMDGDFHMCIWSSGHAFQNQRVARFKSNGEIGNLHLFLALEKPIQEFNKAIVGTTVAHLGDMHIKTIQIVWPPAKLRAKARDVLEPMSEEIIALKRQIQNLRRTRDLLLPRLLSGQVPITNNSTA
jgi:type I restriction enzyme S subunit